MNMFRNSVEKIQVSLKLDKNKAYITVGQYTFLIILRSSLLRMRNASDKVVEKIKTHVVFSNFFSKIVPFMR